MHSKKNNLDIKQYFKIINLNNTHKLKDNQNDSERKELKTAFSTLNSDQLFS